MILSYMRCKVSQILERTKILNLMWDDLVFLHSFPSNQKGFFLFGSGIDPGFNIDFLSKTKMENSPIQIFSIRAFFRIDTFLLHNCICCLFNEYLFLLLYNKIKNRFQKVKLLNQVMPII